MVIGYLQGSRVCHIARMVGCCSNREEVSRSLGGVNVDQVGRWELLGGLLV